MKLEELLKQIRRLNGTCKSLGPSYTRRADSLVRELFWKFGRPLLEEVCCCTTLTQLEKRIESLYNSSAVLDIYDAPRRSLNQNSEHRSFRHDHFVPKRDTRHITSTLRNEIIRPIASTMRPCLFCNQTNHTSSDCNLLKLNGVLYEIISYVFDVLNLVIMQIHVRIKNLSDASNVIFFMLLFYIMFASMLIILIVLNRLSLIHQVKIHQLMSLLQLLLILLNYPFSLQLMLSQR